jgi:hypothetical protein
MAVERLWWVVASSGWSLLLLLSWLRVFVMDGEVFAVGKTILSLAPQATPFSFVLDGLTWMLIMCKERTVIQEGPSVHRDISKILS